MRQRPIVAIDGPSGAGKSTVGRRLARELGFRYVDTGAIYRALALRARDEGVDLGDEPSLAALVTGLEIAFQWRGDDNRVLLSGVDRTEEVRREDVGMAASIVSRYPAVRAGLLDLQRRLGAPGGIVMDGRDIGTVVFPDAEIKFFLTADPAVRARRRHRELQAKGQATSLEQVAAALAERDRQDSEREVAPCRPADDAIVIDSSGMDPGRVLAVMADRVRRLEAEGRRAGAPPPVPPVKNGAHPQKSIDKASVL